MATKSKKSTLERFKEAYSKYNKGEFSSIEEAAKKHRISPATFYNYANRLNLSKKSHKGKDFEDVLKTVEEVKTLEARISELKSKIIESIFSKQ